MDTKRYTVTDESVGHSCCYTAAVLDNGNLIAEFVDERMATRVVDLLNALEDRALSGKEERRSNVVEIEVAE